jgi:hypothetical protein
MKPLVALLFTFAGVGVALADSPRPLKLETVDQVIEQHDRQVQSCSRKLRGDTMAVMVRLEIDGSGKVITADPLNLSSEARCLSRVARTLRFPATGTLLRVDYPFMLLPQLRR